MAKSSTQHTLPSRERHGNERISVFPSELGWIGLVGTKSCVTAVTFGHDTPVQVRLHLEEKSRLSTETPDDDWDPELRERLQDYALGSKDEFADVRVTTEGLTPFRKSVVKALRKVRYGETVSYAELAALAGKPRAARAVGGAMAVNSTPLIVPCHRVIASGGRLGGFSSPSGLTIKEQLLRLEQATGVNF